MPPAQPEAERTQIAGTPMLPQRGSRSLATVWRSQALSALASEAMLMRAVMGRNRRALHRLAMLAHLRGLSPAEAAEALRAACPAGRENPTRPDPLPPGADMSRSRSDAAAMAARPAGTDCDGMAAGGEPSRPSAPPPDDHEQRLFTRGLMGAGVALAGVAAATLLLIIALRPTTAPPGPGPLTSPSMSSPATTGATAQNRTSSDAAPRDEPAAPREARAINPYRPTDPPDLVTLTRRVGAAAQALTIDRRSALVEFEAAVGELARHWPLMPRDRLVATVDAVVEFVYRAGVEDDESPARTVAAIVRNVGTTRQDQSLPAGEVVPAVWSAGVLARLGRERDLPVQVRETIERALREALGPEGARASDFDSGAAAMLDALAVRLATGQADASRARTVDAAAWKHWADAAAALASVRVPEGVAADQAETASRLLLRGLDRLLALGPEPTDDQGTMEAIADLIGRVSWQADGDARRWVIRWFGDRRVSPADLHAVTAALARRSAADKVDVTMILSPSASASARALLRRRYQEAWALGEETARAADQAWTSAASEMIETSTTSARDVDRLAAAAIMARLNESAWWAWRGEGAEATRLLEEARAMRRDIAAMTRWRDDASAVGNRLLRADPRDGEWAERYLAARHNVRERRELLEHLRQRGSRLGPVDAEVLFAEAVLGVPADLRTQAADLVRERGSEPAMLAGALERLGLLPRTPHIAGVLETMSGRRLPAVSDPAWPREARRTLVERLIEVLAVEGPMARADQLARLIAESYWGMASPTPPTLADRHAERLPAVHESASVVRQMWREAAASARARGPGDSPLSLPDVDRRHAGRLAVARGPVHQFLVEQISVAELMACVVAGEDPAHVPAVRAILTQLDQERRQARTVLDQIEACERAILQLWRVRFGEMPDTPGPSSEDRAHAAQPAPAGTGQGGETDELAEESAEGPARARGVIAPERADDAARAALAQRWGTRLAALNPDNPDGYYRLAEEVADEAWDPATLDLARRLYVLAFELWRVRPDGAPWAGSAAVGLAAIEPLERNRTWLLAIAAVLEPQYARHEAPLPPHDAENDEPGYAAATVLGLVRGGEGREARRWYDRPAVRTRLTRYERNLGTTGHTGALSRLERAMHHWPCPQCFNARVVARPGAGGAGWRLCPTCRGNPGPNLTDEELLAQIRLEAALLNGIHRSWGAQIMADGGQPLRDPRAEELAVYYGVDATRPWWRDGKWTHMP